MKNRMMIQMKNLMIIMYVIDVDAKDIIRRIVMRHVMSMVDGSKYNKNIIFYIKI